MHSVFNEYESLYIFNVRQSVVLSVLEDEILCFQKSVILSAVGVVFPVTESIAPFLVETVLRVALDGAMFFVAKTMSRSFVEDKVLFVVERVALSTVKDVKLSAGKAVVSSAVEATVLPVAADVIRLVVKSAALFVVNGAVLPSVEV